MKRNHQKGSNKSRGVGKYVVICCIVAIISLAVRVFILDKAEEIYYDQAISFITNDEVEKIVVSTDSSEVKMYLKDGSTKKCTVPSYDEFTKMVSQKIEGGQKIEFVVGNSQIRSTIISATAQLGLYILLFFLLRKLFGSFKKEEPYKPATSNVCFNDVAGIDEVKSQLEEIVIFLKDPKKYHSKGARMPKGVLLSGAPGTGKTLLAKALAGEAGVPFFQVSGSSFEEMFVGIGASRVRKLFEAAKKHAPSIIFIDELDTLAKARYNGHSHNEQTLNQLLAEMDGFESNNNIVVIAATNHFEVLDPAITRPGRFDRKIHVPMPDKNAREDILTVHAKGKHFAPDVSLREIAKKTAGFSGADLENLLNEAVIYSINMHIGVITNECIDEALARVAVGLKKSKSVFNEKDKYLTAIHEAGHAIASNVLRPEVENFGISIIPRGNAGGYNVFSPLDTAYKTKTDLFNEMKVLYAGRIAEDLIFSEISSGAKSDLEKATHIAHMMVVHFAMTDEDLVTVIPGNHDFNQHLQNCKAEEIAKICKDAYREALELLTRYREAILSLASLLLEKETLSTTELNDFFANL